MQRAARETAKALSVSPFCTSVTGWEVLGDERPMFMSNLRPWSRLLRSKVLPPLTASPSSHHHPPLRRRQTVWVWQTRDWGLDGTAAKSKKLLDADGITWAKFWDLWSSCDLKDKKVWPLSSWIRSLAQCKPIVDLKNLQIQKRVQFASDRINPQNWRDCFNAIVKNGKWKLLHHKWTRMYSFPSLGEKQNMFRSCSAWFCVILLSL